MKMKISKSELLSIKKEVEQYESFDGYCCSHECSRDCCVDRYTTSYSDCKKLINKAINLDEDFMTENFEINEKLDKIIELLERIV